MSELLPPSLWSHTAPSPPAFPTLTDDLDSDIVVIGGGFTGLSAALTCAEAGRKTVLIDAQTIGWGASGRNGGQVNPTLSFHDPTSIDNALSAPWGERLARAAIEAPDHLFDLIDRHQIDCDARRKGWLRVNHCAKAARNHDRAARLWNQLGAELIPLTGQELELLTGTAHYQSGILAPRGGAVHPLKLVRGLAAAAIRSGATLYHQTPALRLSRHGERWRVHCPKAKIDAHQVIIAVNGYADKLLPDLQHSIVPLTSIQIATEPLEPERCEAILPQGHTIADTRRIIMYARREPDRRMIFGGMGVEDRHGNPRNHERLIADAERIFPTLKGVNWCYRWGGRVAITPDHMPHLHQPQPGLIAGLGYNGRGVAMAPYMGHCLGRCALGHAPNDLPFPIRPLKPLPFQRLTTPALALITPWMRLRDRLDRAFDGGAHQPPTS